MEYVKLNWKYWLKSSVFTFLTVALPLFTADVSLVDFNSLETAGFAGSFAIVFRLALKASWAGLVALIQWLSLKLSNE